MATGEYQGWTNYATWIVQCLLNDTQTMHNGTSDLIRTAYAFHYSEAQSQRHSNGEAYSHDECDAYAQSFAVDALKDETATLIDWCASPKANFVSPITSVAYGVIARDSETQKQFAMLAGALITAALAEVNWREIVATRIEDDATETAYQATVAR